MTTRVFIWITSTVIFLALFGSSVSQTKTAPPDPKAENARIAQLQKIWDIVQSVSSLNDLNTSATSLGQIADLVWSKDEPYARSLFSLALTKTDSRQNDTVKEISSKTRARFRVISSIARHDAVWAKTLVESLTKDKTTKAMAKVQIAGDLLESDPGRASDLAAQSLDDEITPAYVSFLRRLRLIDETRANQMFLQLLSRYAVTSNADANNFALLGLYVFRSAHTEPTDVQSFTMVRVGDILMPDISASQPGVPVTLIQNYIRSAISLINRPSVDADQGTVKYALGYLLVPKAQEFAPNMVAELLAGMASLASLVPPVYTTAAGYQYVGKVPSAPEDRIKEIEKQADPYVRDQLFLDMVASAYRRKDFETARLALSKIEDSDLRAELEPIVAFGELNQLLKSERLDVREVLPKIDKLPQGDEKIMLQLAMAAIAKKSGNKDLENEMLGLARDSAKNLNNEMAPFFLMYISGELKKKPDLQSSFVFAEAVKIFNKFDNISEPSLEHSVGTKPLVYRFSIAVKDVNLNFQSTFPSAVAGDEENAILLVPDIRDDRLKGQAYVALAKAILAKKPSPDKLKRAQSLIPQLRDGG